MDELNHSDSLRDPRESIFGKPLPPLKTTKPKLYEITTEPKRSASFDKVLKDAEKLNRDSAFKSTFDYSVYQALEKRYENRPIRGGVTFRSPFRLGNSHATCQQCLYTFEVDAYGRGCAHDCVYCYAKAELTVHGYWNNPIPVPVDINEIRKVFFTVFETDKRSKWREILDRKIPLRIGSMSDSFMFADKKYKVTQELLKILKFYKYPHIIFTRSDLVSHDEYIDLMDKDLVSIQMSISSVNESLNKRIEPGAPSAQRRLMALQKLTEAGFWTTVRINPLFPIYPDGYFTDPNFKWDGEVPKFDYSSFDMVDMIADYKVPAILAGFVRFSSFALNGIQRTTGTDLHPFFRKDLVNKSRRDWHYSDKEIRYYYEQLKVRCLKRKVQFTTCYIGNGESHFWGHQDLWSNKTDCCNAKTKVPAFKTDCREIRFEDRLKLKAQKTSTPTSDRLHDALGKSHDTLVRMPAPKAPELTL